VEDNMLKLENQVKKFINDNYLSREEMQKLVEKKASEIIQLIDQFIESEELAEIVKKGLEAVKNDPVNHWKALEAQHLLPHPDDTSSEKTKHLINRLINYQNLLNHIERYRKTS